MPARDQFLAERQHKVLGLYLAICCWINKLDAIVLERSDFLKFLGLERVKRARVNNFQSDIKKWFPHQYPYFKTKAADCFSAIILSRNDIASKLPKGSMTSQERVTYAVVDHNLKIDRLFNLDGWNKRLDEKQVVSFAALAASGLW